MKQRKDKQKGKRFYDNSGTMNAVLDAQKNPTEFITGRLNFDGNTFSLSGEIDLAARIPSITFVIKSRDANSPFGREVIVSDNGILKLNKRRMNESAPEWRGKFSAYGRDYRISGWVKNHSEYGDFVSLSVQTEDAYQAILQQYERDGKQVEEEMDYSTESETDELPA